MTWLELRYREVLDESLFGLWVTTAPVPEGVRDIQVQDAVRGASYEVQTRRFDDVTGRASEWAPLGIVAVLEPLDRPSAVSGIRVECGEQLVWEPSPDGLGAAYEIRHAPAVYEGYADMQPVPAVTVPGPPFPMCSIPKGLRTIAVRPLSPEGVAGEPTFAGFDLGEYDDGEPVALREVTFAPLFTTDHVLRPGAVVTIENGSVEAPGQLKATSFGAVYWSDPDYPVWQDDAAVNPWPANLYKDLGFIVSYDPAAVASGHYDFRGEGVVLSLGPVVFQGENWRGEYRLHDAPAWTDNDTDAAWHTQDTSLYWHGVDDSSPVWGHADDPFWGPDDFGLAWQQYPWRPWPGRLRLNAAQRIDFRIVIPGRPVRPILADLEIRETRPYRIGEELASFLHGHELSDVAGALSAEEIQDLIDASLPDSGWSTLTKAADQTGIGESATDITGLTLAVSAGQTLRFRARLRHVADAPTTGANFSVNGPAASDIAYSVMEWTGTTGVAFATHNGLDEFANRATSAGTEDAIAEVEGVIRFTASGTFALRCRAETGSGGTVDVLEGSWLEYLLE